MTTYKLRNLIHSFSILACCLVGCSCQNTNPSDIQSLNVESIEYRPVEGGNKVFTNVDDINVIVEWINQTFKAPISNFTLRDYPKPIHIIAIKFKAGEITEILISGGQNGGDRDFKNSKLVKSLSIISFKNREYIAKSRPEGFFPLP